MTTKQSPLLEQAGRHEDLIEATEVSKTYATGKHQVQALKGVSLQIQRGEVVAIMGPSGCGKTTLLNCLSGLDQVTSGIIRIAGQDIRGLSDRELTTFRACEMGFVFQTYNLLPVLSGLENVELPLLVSGVRPKEARERALASIERVGLRAWGRHRPAEMSGGQRQRFAIARALATNPSIVWADEPTGALDSQTSQEIIDLMLSLNREHGLTFVWVTHALEVAMQAQRLITMHDGLIEKDHPVDPLPPPPLTRISLKSKCRTDRTRSCKERYERHGYNSLWFDPNHAGFRAGYPDWRRLVGRGRTGREQPFAGAHGTAQYGASSQSDADSARRPGAFNGPNHRVVRAAG